jgi:hypothetical protein
MIQPLTEPNAPANTIHSVPPRKNMPVSPAARWKNSARFLVAEYPYAAGQTIHVLTNCQQRMK